MPDEPKRPLKVFLSYASQDKPVVRELSGRLAGEGWIDPWVDEKKLLPGQDWRTKIEEAVEISDVVIVVLSSNSVTKEGFVQKELRYAREIAFEKPDETIFLIPLRLDDCSVPRGLRFYQWVDYFGDKKDESYGALIESLRLRYEQKLMLEEQERVRKEKLEREREAAEQARLEAEEQVRQKTATEKAEREESERLAREKEEKDAAEKVRLEAEEQARQKATKEKAERDEAERLAREKAEKDAAEKARLEAEEQAILKATREQAKQETSEKSNAKAAQPKSDEEKPVEKPFQVVSKESGTRNLQTRSDSQIAFWVVGGIVVIFLITILSLNNRNTPSTVVPTLTPTLFPTKIPTATIYAGSLPTEINDDKGVQMVLIPAGEFMMSTYNYELSVYLDDYYIDRYEVTNVSYKVCVNDGACSLPEKNSSLNRDTYYDDLEFSDFPVVYVTWEMADTFCKWRDGNLPTSAQWEKAARGTDGRIYPWGETIDETYANYNSNLRDTTAVGSYPRGKSPYGVYDMAGNVDEWVADWFSFEYQPSSANPLGPPRPESRDDEFKETRGGSWINFDYNVISSSSDANRPWFSDYDLGFRCARDATP